MNLIISRIEDHGTLTSEKVILTVNQKTNLKYFIIRDTSYTSEDKVSNKWNHAYKFTDQQVEKGDEVVLFTSTTSKTTEKINNGKNTRYYYSWNLKSSIWNTDGDAAGLYEISTWVFFKVHPAN